MTISPKQKDELITAIKKYGEAEVKFGKVVGGYKGGLEWSLEDAAIGSGNLFEKVINIIHKL